MKSSRQVAMRVAYTMLSSDAMCRPVLMNHAQRSEANGSGLSSATNLYFWDASRQKARGHRKNLTVVVRAHWRVVAQKVCCAPVFFGCGFQVRDEREKSATAVFKEVEAIVVGAEVLPWAVLVNAKHWRYSNSKPSACARVDLKSAQKVSCVSKRCGHDFPSNCACANFSKRTFRAVRKDSTDARGSLWDNDWP